MPRKPTKPTDVVINATSTHAPVPTSDPTTPPVVTDTQLALATAAANAITHPVVTGAMDLVITDSVSYETASVYLSRVLAAKKELESDNSILGQIIRPIRASLDKLYAIRRKALIPLESAERVTKDKMREFKLIEQRKIDEANARKRLEQERLERESRRIVAEAQANDQRIQALQAQAQAQAQSQADNHARAQQLADAQAKAQQLAYDIETSTRIAQIAANEPPVITQVKSTTSSARVLTKWRFNTSKHAMNKLIKLIANADLPEDLLTLNEPVINAYFADPEYWEVLVTESKGLFESYTDIQIAGKGNR